MEQNVNNLEYGQWATYQERRFMVVDWTTEDVIGGFNVKLHSGYGNSMWVRMDELTNITDYLDASK